MKISEIIIDWYKKNKRNLPWRQTNDPYRIWLSEIILQQTRVIQGLEYYNRFIERYKTVEELAGASEQEVMKLWQGLGYYSRARNLLIAARWIVEENEGKFPANYSDLLKLKGVGPYTAAAIASIAYDEAVAVVDGNVDRVISRLFEVSEAVNSSKGSKIIREYANQILDSNHAGTFNQALMEFGALQCLPQNPKCASCPLANQCGAYQNKMVSYFPLKIKNTKIRTRYFIYLIILKQGFTFIRQRTSKGIWQQLFEFPLIESDNPIYTEEIEGKIIDFTGFAKAEFIIKAISKPVKHQLSHQTIMAKFVHIEVLAKDYKGLNDWVKIKMKNFSDYPIPRIIDRYMESYNENTD